jgi:hypothetical protein
MSATIREAKHFINLLVSGSNLQRKSLLKIATRQQIRAVKEIFVNILHGNIVLSESQKSTLQKYKNILRDLTQKHLSKRKMLRYVTVIVKILIVVVPLIHAL